MLCFRVHLQFYFSRLEDNAIRSGPFLCPVKLGCKVYQWNFVCHVDNWDLRLAPMEIIYFNFYLTR